MLSFQLAALAGFVAAAPMTDMDFKFINYVAKFNKSYATSEEYAARQEIFAAKDVQITIENTSQSSYVLAHNKFSDYTDHEYKRLLGSKQSLRASDRSLQSIPVNAAVPDWSTGVNWFTAGAVTPIKD